MGIADDIKPRKYRRIINHAKKEKKGKAVDSDNYFFFSQPNDDDFFAGTPIDDQKQKNKSPKTNTKNVPGKVKNASWLYTLIIIAVIGLLITIIIWQNLSAIKGFIDGSYKEQNDQSLEEIIANQTTNDKNKIDTESADQGVEQEQENKTNIDKSNITISVLNGSGVKLAAQNLANILTTDGFVISYIGNAKSFNYQITTIYYHTGKEDEANLVKSALDTHCQTVIEKNDNVTGNLYDLVVVTGKN